MRSIRIKMVVMYLIMVLIVMAAVGTFTIVLLTYNVERKAQEQLSDYADMIRDAVIRDHESADFHQALRLITQHVQLANPIEYYILDDSVRLLATSEAEDLSLVEANVYSVSAVINALENKDGKQVFSSGRVYPNIRKLLPEWMEYARAVSKNGETYVLYLRMDAYDSYESIKDIVIMFLLGLVIAFVLAIILGVFFAGSVNKPITLLTKKAREFAGGDLDQDIEVYSNDEIGELTESFNNMAHELKLTLFRLENEKNKIEIVLHNVTDGVLAYDMSGRLIHANHVCEELLGITNIERVTFAQMLRYLGITDINDGIQSPGDMVLHINDRFINIVINYYKGKTAARSDQGGVVLLLQDLTKHIHLDNMRKEFVANVSHELRTPLTTIKSYTETLLEEIMDSLDYESHTTDFLKTIDGEADRMTILVNDLLELSRLDNKQLEFNFETVDLIALINNNVIKHRHALEKRQSGKVIVFEPTGEEMLVRADHERINQVINNIITNSIRYSGDDAIIEVTAERKENIYYVHIKDNGVGIPPDDIGRIFERFYRVDKARSRELGGTGLGLSISKEIVEAHGGTLTAESRLGEGTRMTITLNPYS